MDARYDKVPCKDCLILPICKGKLEGGDMINLMCLADTCSLLKAYIRPKKKYPYAPNHLDTRQLQESVNEGLHRVDIVEAFFVDMGTEYSKGGVDFNKVRANDNAV